MVRVQELDSAQEEACTPNTGLLSIGMLFVVLPGHLVTLFCRFPVTS